MHPSGSGNAGGGPAPIPAVLMRGGTSKGIFLHAKDLPPPGRDRDDLLLRIMGSPDPMQIDGMGGTFSSTSKVVIIEPRGDDGVTYWFAQISVDEPIVDWSGNCGNLTTAVGPFAIDEGLVRAVEPMSRLRLFNGNTGVTVEADVLVAGARAATTGDCAIPGVPGTGSPVVTRYLDPAGGVLGALLPTGAAANGVTTADGTFPVSIVDATHPYAFVPAASLGLAEDTRSPAELNADPDFLALVERIRAACAVLVGSAPSAEAAASVAPATPRIVLIRPGDSDADLAVTAFSMGKTHRALPMTGALCAAAAARTAGTTVADCASPGTDTVRIRHPRGVSPVLVETDGPRIRSVAVVRTARRLMGSVVYPRAY
jgi:2-methylaconitate cis-trans-isomerase PrpF